MGIKAFKTTVPLHDLGTIRPEWSGILSPLYGDETIQHFIHTQFLEEASTYVDRYQDVDYWTRLLRSAQQYLPTESPTKILDIGSGAGNTIFALLQVYPHASIIASDLSVPLLVALKNFYEQSYHDHSCVVMQLNAEDLIFEENQFDLVVGGAILHHLFSPEKTLAQCYKVLKQGGHAIFFEPFELGNQVVALILQQLMQMNQSPQVEEKISETIIRFFQNLCYDFEVRKGTDKSAEIFQRIDDKWLFTRQYFEMVASSTGFQKEVVIFPLHETSYQFTKQTNTYLNLGVGASLSDLPIWAILHLTQMDFFFSEAAMSELIIEGGVILRK